MSKNRRVKITAEFTITGTQRVKKRDKDIITDSVRDAIAEFVYGFINYTMGMANDKETNERANLKVFWEDKIVE